MASFNRVLLMGNLTRDPQLKYLPSQTAVVDFGLACNRKFKTKEGVDKDEVTFVDCTAFGRTGEVINQYFTKGKPIFIEGRLKYDQWEDKQGGGKRHKISVVIENFQFVGGRDGGDSGDGRHTDHSTSQERPSRPGPAGRGPAPRPAVDPPFGDEQQFKDDDIPF